MSLIWNETEKADILKKWEAAKPKRLDEAKARMLKLVKNRGRYEAVQKRTGVPWWFIMCLHERESSGDMATYLGNGEKLTHVTHLVPVGRGPFSTFEDGAVDALVHEGFHKVVTWSIARILFCAEKFNGPGYHNKGLPSPYVWAGTDQYSHGKYDQDGHYVSTLIDPQLGVAVMIMALIDLKIISLGEPKPKTAPIVTTTMRTAASYAVGAGGALAVFMGLQAFVADLWHILAIIGGAGALHAGLWSQLNRMHNSDTTLTATIADLEASLAQAQAIIGKTAQQKRVEALKAADPVVAAAHVDDDDDGDGCPL